NIKNVVFDFSKVTFMDSSGIGMIIGRYKLVEKKGGSAAICSMAPEIKKLFDISGLGKIINHYADSKEALSKMQ
ncbi:anti-sigma factor antagonist, partial [Tyzzerella sp. OttesenSCG-928-J15]|nr:anti-sigma factor antagonist [Tyzzerella sp. OttesenSCG-928-J15]